MQTILTFDDIFDHVIPISDRSKPGQFEDIRCVGFIIHTTLQRLLFAVLLFCACCSICRYIGIWTVCSHFMLGLTSFTFYVTLIPVTVCECHIGLKAT